MRHGLVPLAMCALEDEKYTFEGGDFSAHRWPATDEDADVAIKKFVDRCRSNYNDLCSTLGAVSNQTRSDAEPVARLVSLVNALGDEAAVKRAFKRVKPNNSEATKWLRKEVPRLQYDHTVRLPDHAGERQYPSG